MSGVTPNEGLSYIAEKVYNSADLIVGLFTNSSGLTNASQWADIVQPVGNGYAEVTVPAGSWTIVNGDVTLATLIEFPAVGGNITPVYGAYIRTIDVTPRILHFEVDPAAGSGGITVQSGTSYRANLTTVAA